jgi:DNA-binding protein H-NS
MKKTYQQIRRQIEGLEREAEKLKRAEVAGVIERIRLAIDTYGITAADLGLGVSSKVAKVSRKSTGPSAKTQGSTGKALKKRKVPVKFRDQSGNTWTGRGSQPRWLKDALATGRSLDEFRV